MSRDERSREVINAVDNASRYREMMAKRTNDEMGDIFDKLSNTKLNGRLPEELFVKEFLPYFMGKVPPENAQGIVAKWIAVAGSPTAEVDVLDKDLKTVLFTVPAVISTHSISTERNGRGLGSIIYNAQLRDKIPGQSESFANKALSDKSTDMIKPRVNVTIEQRWINIISRYTSDSKQENNSNTLSKSKNIAPSIDDTIYDDFT